MGNDLLINENMYGYAKDKDQSRVVDIEYCIFMENESIIPPHWHEQLLLMYIEKGTLELTCGEQKVIANQGEIIIVNPYEIHSIENPNSVVEYYLLKLDISLLLGNQPDLRQIMCMDQLLKNRILFKNKITNDNFLVESMKFIINEFLEKKQGYTLAIRGLSYQILTALLRRYAKTIPDQAEYDMQYRRVRQIKPVITYIEEHYSEKITLDELSAVIHLSTIHFSRVFKTVTGFSPMEFLNRVRIQKAVQLLLKTDKSIVEIAMDTGFNDGNYFSRFFKKCRKETPSEFRNKYIRNEKEISYD
ncbi:AraC family transcriptional regulator [Clostridium sp. YIM B02551]|uniref:AraC family transcriptional regulator n=1 Tax=Clostridium sp. YIM B02551 TaxID=2910679 RepID=UPI001EECEE3E|nr:AraC family transcriptional regulator [Clostridium sp. YIM B02551]